MAAKKHVHRGLVIGHAGPDVEQLRHGINRKARGWELPQFEVTVSQAPLEPEELSAAVHLLHAMGLGGKAMKRARNNDILSEYAQRLLRGTRPRLPWMIRLSRRRRPQVRAWRQAFKLQGEGFEIVPRAEWGARPPQGGLVPQATVREIFIHHTVYPTLPANASVAEEKARMRDLQAFHQRPKSLGGRGYTDVAYQVVVMPSGRMYEGRPLDYQGAHTANRNSTSKAVCFDGSFHIDRPTEEAVRAAAWAVRQLGRGVPVRPHSSVYPTACPGDYVKARLGDLR